MSASAIDPQNYARLACKIANEFWRRGSWRNAEREDVQQEAMYALCKAAKSYDPTNDAKASFVTYATKYIRGWLKGYRSRDRRLVSIGNLSQIARGRLARHDWHIDPEEIATRLEQKSKASKSGITRPVLTIEEAHRVLGWAQGDDVSLFTSFVFSGTHENKTWEEFVADEDAADAAPRFVEGREVAARVAVALEKIRTHPDWRRGFVLDTLILAEDEGSTTLDDVGWRVGLSREGVRQIKLKVLRDLRHELEREGVMEKAR